MDCALAREAISATLDGENPGADSGRIEQHLAECAECRAWREAAHEVTRRVRLRPAQPVPRRTREAAAAVLASQRRWPIRPVPLYRAGLVAVAAGQLAITVPCLLLGEDRSAPMHVAHELGSFDAALAAGFLVVAWRPGRALGMRALVGAAAVLLVLTAVIDVASRRTGVLDEAPHLLALAGWLMIRGLAAGTPPTVTEPRSRLLAMVRSQLWGGAPPAAQPDLPAAPDSPAAARALELLLPVDVLQFRAEKPGEHAQPGEHRGEYERLLGQELRHGLFHRNHDSPPVCRNECGVVYAPSPPRLARRPVQPSGTNVIIRAGWLGAGRITWHHNSIIMV